MNGRKLNFDEIKKDRIKTHFLITLNLNAANSNLELNLNGRFIYVLDISPMTTQTASIRLNDPDSPSINLYWGRKIVSPFYRIFLTNPAQGAYAASLTLLIGADELNFDITEYAPHPSLRPANVLNFYNLTLTNAGTEYSQTIPSMVKKIIIKARTADIKFGLSGSTGTTYFTISTGQTLILEDLNFAIQSLCFQSATAGTVVEIIVLI